MNTVKKSFVISFWLFDLTWIPKDISRVSKVIKHKDYSQDKGGSTVHGNIALLKLVNKPDNTRYRSACIPTKKKGQKRTMTTFRDTFLQPALNDRSFKRKAYFLLQETALCFYHICKNGVSTSSRLQCSPTCVVAYICSGIVGQSMI